MFTKSSDVKQARSFMEVELNYLKLETMKLITMIIKF